MNKLYYYDRKYVNNLNSHIEKFNNIAFENKIFIIYSVTNNKEQFKEIYDDLYNILNLKINTTQFHILIDNNWGGTIAGLYNSYKFIREIEKNYLENIFISHFEEDFYYINNNWLNDSLELFLEKKYIYIGEVALQDISVKKSEIKKEYLDTFNNTTLNNTEYFVWTDGGYYFTNITNLCIIEELLNGNFHKGNQNLIYDHTIDGIILGEVGFPTLLFINKLNFIGLPRLKYFTP